MIRTVHAVLLAAALALAPPVIAQNTTFPATPQGETAKTWLSAFNDPDVSVLQSVDPRAVPFRPDVGGYDLINVESASSTQIVIFVRDRMFGNYQRLTFYFDGANPTRIANLRLLPATPPPGAPGVERLADTALGDFIDEAVKRIGYSGAVLVARDGTPVATAVAGLADREANIPNVLETRFRVGSMNKMMTATAIMQLVQTGAVKLDAPVGTYLKDYPNKPFASAVTIHHLLSHTGGAGDIFGPQFTAKRLELRTLRDYVQLYGARAPEFTPGDDWRYANYGFILLGRVIEEVSGQSYPDYVRDHIFAPAGMSRSGFEPENVTVEGRSKGYMTGPKGLESNADTLPWSGTSAGGGYSTVEDWLAFANALTGHKLLDKPHTDLLMSRKTSTGYAYGFGDNSSSEIHAAGHNGGAPGMNGDFRILADGQVVIVTLSNVSPPSQATTLAGEIAKRVQVRKPDGAVAQVVWTSGALPPATEEQRMAAFRAADTDGDGKLDKAAFRKALEQLGFADRFEPLFKQRDADKDGFVSEAEARTSDLQ